MRIKRPHIVTIQGREHEWSLDCYLSDEARKDMRADGLEVYELRYNIPAWVADCGLTRVWCFFYDILKFRWPP
jgi:hypothetical protein